jgi:hypothetical protein
MVEWVRKKNKGAPKRVTAALTLHVRFDTPSFPFIFAQVTYMLTRRDL